VVDATYLNILQQEYDESDLGACMSHNAYASSLRQAQDGIRCIDKATLIPYRPQQAAQLQTLVYDICNKSAIDMTDGNLAIA
jgi:hypothetical protein